MNTLADLSSAAACQCAFYSAFSKGDLDAMREVWSPADDVICIHPGSAALTGLDAIVRSWEMILGAERMHITSSPVGEWLTADIATFTVTEHLFVSERNVRGETLATNAFRFEDGLWRMILHHGSPKATSVRTAADDSPGTVH